MTTAYDIVGLIGSFIISAALIPQLTKVYRTKSANDISYHFVCMYITGLSCLAVYGIGESLWPIYIPSTLELLGAIALLALKVAYRNNIPLSEMDKSYVHDGPKSGDTPSFVTIATPK